MAKLFRSNQYRVDVCAVGGRRLNSAGSPRDLAGAKMFATSILRFTPGAAYADVSPLAGQSGKTVRIELSSYSEREVVK
jgi:hypothetical protein